MAGLLEDRTGIKARTPMPVHDVTNATSKTQITSEAVSFADGATGTTQRLKLTYDGVMSQYGERIGMDGDTSFSFGTGTILATQVPWRFKGTQGKDNETDRLDSMANGEFMIDHENGFILGKNASATSSTTDTATYKVRLQATATISGGGGDASAANQTSEIALLTTIDADTGSISTSTAAAATSLDVIEANTTGLAQTVKVDDSVFNIASDRVLAIGAVADETTPDSVDEGDIGVLRMTLTRFLKTSLGDLIAGENITEGFLAVQELSSATSTGKPSLDVSAAAEASSIPKASAGVIYSFTATNSSASARYFQVANSATLPADATVPIMSYYCAAGGTVSEQFVRGRYCSAGIVWCWSSTAATKTIGSTDGICDFRYA